MAELKNGAINTLIEPQLLIAAGGLLRKYGKDKVIFHEGDAGIFYYQIVSGSVSIVNVKEDGSEFIQGIFGEGQSFGLPATLLGETYPATAVSSTDTVLVRLGRSSFLQLLKEYPDVLMDINLALSRKLYQKAMIGKGISSQKPEERIRILLKLLRKESDCPEGVRCRLSISRQQLADMIGMRVETVIRSLKKLEKGGAVQIEHGKVYY